MADGDCRLLQLRPELRNWIYELVLTIINHDSETDDTAELNLILIAKRPRFGNNASTFSVQALLQTCRQIHMEATSVFYEVNCIDLTSRQLAPFLRSMRLQRPRTICQISIYDTSLKMTGLKFLEHLKQLPKLRTLSIASEHLIFDPGTGTKWCEIKLSQECSYS